MILKKTWCHRFLVATSKQAYLDIIHSISHLVFQLSSHYTIQYTRVSTVHLTLTLSSTGSPLRVFSPFKPLIPTITFKDTMWTQALMSDK